MSTVLRDTFASGEPTSTRDKRRRIVLLRSLVVIALGALIAGSEPAPLGWALITLTVFALSNLVLAMVPLRLLTSWRFELALGAVDIVLLSAGVQLSESGSYLIISCLLMVLVVAVGHYEAHVLAGAAGIGAFHAWHVLGHANLGVGHLALQMVFLASVAVYFGFLVRRVHRWRRRAEADGLERRELRALLDILDDISRTLDLRQVALRIVTKIATVIPALRCSMLFVDPSQSRCFVLASHDDPELELLEIDLKKYPEVRRAIETRNPVLVHNAPEDPIIAEVRALLEKLDFQSILVVPLTFRDSVLGTLCLKTTRAKDEFSAADINFCNAVASASANALQNALLHDQVLEEACRHRATNEKLTRIMDHSPDLILTTDYEGRVTEFNRGAEQLLGHERDQVIGKHCEELFGPGSGRELIDRIRADGKLSNYTCQVRRDDGSELTLQMNMSVLGDDRGAMRGTVWVGRDVSELRTAQLQLLQAKKLSTIGEVISGVAHELNNPLSAVLGFSQLVTARYPDAPMIRELEKVHDSALRCQKIVKNLLSFARVHKPERKYLGINGIIEKTLELRKYQLQVTDIEVVKQLDPTLPRTMLDFHQMQQVLLNLINNAHHAILASKRRDGCLIVRTRHEEGQIRIEISDNGVGMDPETLERVFDPFFTTKKPGQGTGLGLSVSYGIVKEHGGRIFARSRQGQGTTLQVQLPVRGEERTGPRAALETPAGQLSVTGHGGRLLVVDDEPMILDLIVDVFTEQGYSVDTASNGSEACRKIRAQNYDVVVTDVRMPEMNGIELYREIEQIRPEMKSRVVFMTGDLIDRETVRFLHETDAVSIPKPLEIPLVMSIVADKIEQRT